MTRSFLQALDCHTEQELAWIVVDYRSTHYDTVVVGTRLGIRLPALALD